MAVKILVCYARVDEPLVDRLKKLLEPLQQHDEIELYDCEVEEGAHWKQVIDKHLNMSQIILLLVSPDFMVTDYPYSTEMSHALERHERGEALVIPIILRPVYWQKAPFAKLQILPTNGNYVTSPSWGSLDEALFDVSEGIRKAIEKFGVKPAAIAREKLEELEQSAIPPVKNRTTGLRNVAITCVCPSCSEEFYLGDCRIVSRVAPGKELKPAPEGWLQRQMARLRPEPLTGRKYVLEWASRECPACGYLLPYNIEQVASVRIVVVGDTASGKSTYMAALLHQMQEWIQRNSGSLRFTSLTQGVEAEFFRDYLDPVFHNRRVLPPTRPTQSITKNPLIYELETRQAPKFPARKINLILYDDASEDYMPPERMAQFARHFFFANAIILLVDPNTIPEISSRLPQGLQYGTSTGRSASRILNSIIETLKRYHGSEAMNDLPVAITISKSDLLKYKETVGSSYRFSSNPTYNDGLDLQDIRAVDKEVRTIIREIGDQGLLSAAQKLKQVNFFAVSATGYMPDENGTYPSVTPYRCLDPLLWILYELGIIGASVP